MVGRWLKGGSADQVCVHASVCGVFSFFFPALMRAGACWNECDSFLGGSTEAIGLA